MAGTKTIKGLTVEIGGDPTKLLKAMESVNERGKDLSLELGRINSLLRLDPKNTELLAQKQKVLSEAIANTSEKLDKLREAERQVQAQFERGEVSEEQVRDLKREIMATTLKLQSYERAVSETDRKMKGFGISAAEMGEKIKTAGAVAGKSLTVLIGLVAAAGTALIGAAEASREYRTEMGKLSTAFGDAGHDGEAALGTYKELQAILGETEQAVEASGHLAKLCDTQEELARMVEASTGVYATFGASLPVENLAEAANETAKTGIITGGLADALNWAGVSEAAFQAELEACSDEQERQTLIIDTLNDLYADAAKRYREVNAEVIRANRASEEWAATLAEIGGVMEPLITDAKLLVLPLMEELVPAIQTAAGEFRALLDGDPDAASSAGEAVASLADVIIRRLTDKLPSAVGAAIDFLEALTISLVEEAPELVESLVWALVDGGPRLTEAAVELLLAILDAVGVLISSERFAEAIPLIVTGIVEALMGASPELVEGALVLLLAVCDAVPLLCKELVPMIPDIAAAIITGLLDCVPELQTAAGELLWQVVSQLPESSFQIGVELVKGLIDGIFSVGGWAKDKLSEWGGNIIGFLQNLFDIHSPSRVTAWMGEMLDEGLALGIEDNAGSPLGAMRRLSDGLLDEAGEPDGLALERTIRHSLSTRSAEAQADSATVERLDRILEAVKRGHIIVLDGKKVVGATADEMNSALGKSRVLADRGAL